jgi:hypothetical protein
MAAFCKVVRHHPSHFVLSTILGTGVGLLMCWSFQREYEQRTPVVLAAARAARLLVAA